MVRRVRKTLEVLRIEGKTGWFPGPVMSPSGALAAARR